MRGETCMSCIVCRSITFQSTPLMRGETIIFDEFVAKANISIHSPHARGDKNYRFGYYSNFDFNPLPSCEGRQSISIIRIKQCYFNPLPSCEGRRSAESWRCSDLAFQSTPLMRGETPKQRIFPLIGEFQSTPLMRGETRLDMWTWPKFLFQSTPLMRGETL